MIAFSKPTITEEEIEAAAAVMRSGWLAAGPETEAFEQEFAEYVGVKHAIFTNSCTSALKMAYKYLLETDSGAYIHYPENTFCATYSAAIEMGLESFPRAADGSTLNREDKWLAKYRVNMAYGSIKDENPCFIEDSAHRIEPNDPLVGKIRCYSFYTTKNMTTSGAGGMLVTNDEEIYKTCRTYWRDGLTTTTLDRQSGPVDYEVVAMAGGYDSTDVAAAVGRTQLRKLPDFTRRRNQIRERYNAAFGTEWAGNHLFCLDLGSPSRVSECRKYLWELGIGSGYHYPGTGWTKISLPIYPLLTDDEQDIVIRSVKSFLA